jgi:predicted aspartyl protease
MKISLDRSIRGALVVRMTVYGPEEMLSWRLSTAVDRGAGLVVIPRVVANSLGYAPHRAKSRRVLYGDGAIDAPEIVLSRVEIDGASAPGVRTVCHDLPRGCPVEGPVGLSFLTRFRVAFDLPAGRQASTPGIWSSSGAPERGEARP